MIMLSHYSISAVGGDLHVYESTIISFKLKRIYLSICCLSEIIYGIVVNNKNIIFYGGSNV